MFAKANFIAFISLCALFGLYECSSSSSSNNSAIVKRQVRNPCSSSPCLNQGICNFVASNLFTCSCRTGFSGPLCQFGQSSVCVGVNACQNGTLCFKWVVYVTIVFKIIYSGGICRQINTFSAFCECPSGYTGTYCQYASRACSGVSCQNGKSQDHIELNQK
jgi:hypothetical protein